MERLRSAVLFSLCGFLAAPLIAQTQIGGGTCSSATLSGIYAFSLTGRQVTSSGNFTNVFQANGSANFDGLSMVTVTLTAGTIKAVGSPLTWSGTYSIQSNCVGVVNITSGGSVTLNLVLYDTGTDFLVTGSDATYSYSGTGNTQPTGCTAGTFIGVYTFNGTGYALSGGAVAGVGDGVGLLQFDGQSNLTVNVSLASSGKAASPATLTGTYSVSSNCLGSATLTDSSANSYVMSFSVSSATKANSAALYTTLAQNGKLLLSGAAHAIYGQPMANASDRESEGGLATNSFAKPTSEARYPGE